MKNKMTPEQVRAATPATEKWVQDALRKIGKPALDNDNNHYAYALRLFELAFPRIARITIPLFAKEPRTPWNAYVPYVLPERPKREKKEGAQ